MSIIIPEKDLPASLTPRRRSRRRTRAELAEVAGKLGPRAADASSSATRNSRRTCSSTSATGCAGPEPPVHLPRRPARAGRRSRAADADGPDRHHDRAAARGRPRGRRAARRRAAAPRPAHHQPGRADRRGPRGHPAAVREPGAGLARVQGPVVPAAEGDREPVPAPASASSASAANRLRHLVTQKESRKFGQQFNPWQLYKYVSGVNAVRLRKLLSHARGRGLPGRPEAGVPPAPPGDARRARWKSRTSTSTSDIGGYAKVKEQLRKRDPRRPREARTSATDADEIARLEELIPRGHDLLGPAGHRQDALRQGDGHARSARPSPSSPGPELKSEVGRRVAKRTCGRSSTRPGSRPRRSSSSTSSTRSPPPAAPTPAAASSTRWSTSCSPRWTASTRTNWSSSSAPRTSSESLDPALLRPGRFEFHLHIPYPDDDDRREILKIYDKKMKLQFTEEALDYAVRRTGERYMTADRHRVQRRPPQRPVPGGRPPPAAREHHRRDDAEGRRAGADRVRGEGRTDTTRTRSWWRRTRPGTSSCRCSARTTRRRSGSPSRARCRGRRSTPQFKQDDSRRIGIQPQRDARRPLRAVRRHRGRAAAARRRLHRGERRSATRARTCPGPPQLAECMVEVCGMSNLAAPLRSFRDHKGDRDVLSGSDGRGRSTGR